MKNKIMKIFLFLLWMPMLVNAADYTIQSYDINMKVNENNTFDITETITADFHISKHGIIRKIPLVNQINRVDGTSSRNKAKISNIRVNQDYQLKKEDGYQIIQIGNSSTTVKGLQSYVISYTYNIGKDPLKEVDELYYNLIGTEWDTIINQVTFTITMPKSFDASSLGFATGSKGSTNQGVKYMVKDKTITGSYNKTLSSYQGLTVRLTLPEGYFVGASNKTSIRILAEWLPIILVIISLLIWFKYGKNDPIVDTVEFYPPENFNSLEVAFVKNGSVENKDVTSLLIYLANKGYIKIEEVEKNQVSQYFKFTKLKEYDGNDAREKKFLDDFFALGNEVTLIDLVNRFYKTVNDIKKDINQEENIKKLYTKKSLKMGKVFSIEIGIMFSVFLLCWIIEGNAGVIISSLPILIMTVFIFRFISKLTFKKKEAVILMIIWSMFFGGIPLLIMVISLITTVSDMILIGEFILALIIIVILKNKMPKRTPEINIIYGKIKGFEKFLNYAKKDELENLVSRYPHYFYDILPYTYVMGISDKWISKFEDINLSAPEWYSNPNPDFNMITFNHMINSSLNACTCHYMRSSDSSSSSSDSNSFSSSSSSGGGSSGGGSGGGGGSSW